MKLCVVRFRGTGVREWFELCLCIQRYDDNMILAIFPDNAVECTPSSIQGALLPVNMENMTKKASVLHAVERQRHELSTKVFEYLDVRADKRNPNAH